MAKITLRNKRCCRWEIKRNGIKLEAKNAHKTRTKRIHYAKNRKQTITSSFLHGIYGCFESPTRPSDMTPAATIKAHTGTQENSFDKWHWDQEEMWGLQAKTQRSAPQPSKLLLQTRLFHLSTAIKKNLLERGRNHKRPTLAQDNGKTICAITRPISLTA